MGTSSKYLHKVHNVLCILTSKQMTEKLHKKKTNFEVYCMMKVINQKSPSRRQYVQLLAIGEEGEGECLYSAHLLSCCRLSIALFLFRRNGQNVWWHAALPWVIFWLACGRSCSSRHVGKKSRFMQPTGLATTEKKWGGKKARKPFIFLSPPQCLLPMDTGYVQHLNVATM